MKTYLFLLFTFLFSITNAQDLEAKKEKMYSLSENEKASSLYKKGKDYMEKENYNKAIGYFKKALKADPNFILALDDIAACYRRKEDFATALQYYDKSLALFPEGDFSLTNIAVIYSLIGKYDKSIFYYAKMMQYYPESAEGYFGMARIYVMKDEPEKALRYIFQAHRIYLRESSDYTKDAEAIEKIILQMLQKVNKENFYHKLAKEYGFE